MRARRLAALFLALALPAAAFAGPCEDAIRSAELSYAVPPGLLLAIGRVEAGRADGAGGALRVWPWTTNADGQGAFHASAPAARAAVAAMLAGGVRSLDVGCVQINLQAHPDALRATQDILDPLTNARYGARFLRALRDELGSWTDAVAAYHSRTPARGAAYRTKVAAMAHGTLPGAAEPAAPTSAWAPRGTQYGAFAPAATVYGAFAVASAPPPRRTRLDYAQR